MYKILVVEDQKMLRTILCDMLAENNFHAIEASDGMEAIDKIETDSVDAVITDIMMPNYNGVDFLEMITTLHPEIKVLVATSLEPTEDLRKKAGTLVGEENFLRKPVNEDEVICKINSLLGH